VSCPICSTLTLSALLTQRNAEVALIFCCLSIDLHTLSAMAAVSSPFKMSLHHGMGLGMHDEGDFILEDAGFFGTSSSEQPSNSQEALNMLGLQPSPSKGRMFMEDDDGMPFDLDNILDMEEEQMEEQEMPDEYLDDILESNGLLQTGPHSPPHALNKTSSEQSTVKTMIPVIPPPLIDVDHLDDQPRASTSRSAALTPILVEEADDQIGLNGLPKYIAAGITTATLLDGTIIRFEKKRRMKGWKPKPAHYGSGATGLLSRPVHQIIDKIEAMAALKVVQDAEKKPIRTRKTVLTHMWQERYRPQRFTDLVGEERTHRDVLRWLKEWDACVFGKKAHLRKKWTKQNDDKDGFVHSDKWSRPRERILLLGGPAGMGKTTLAHVLARQCGYHVHELNASDDRSAKTVEDRVRDALESKSLKQQTDRPTCLVLDEVDGATGGRGEEGGGFIKALIKLVEKGAGSNGKKKGSKKGRPLLRPIICICNDPYSPNLRALRPYSKLIRVSRPSTPLLIKRLRQICDIEGIPADSKGLNTLIDSCQGDIRSCLNTLQLIQSDEGGLTAQTSKHKDELDQRLASALSIKDGSTSIHQIWSQLFQSLTTREKAQKRNYNKQSGEDSGQGVNLVGSILHHGDMDKVLAGCFEHYPTLKLVDDGWWRFKKMHDWIYWYESINKRSWQVGAQTEMWSYLPWSFLGWKHLFANTANELPEYPRVDYQNHLQKSAFEEVTTDLIACLPPATRSHFDRLSVITELGPCLVTLVSPDLKLINSQLVRPDERSTLTSLIDIMNHCNLEFVLDKNEQGQSFYRLEPPLEVFVNFEGKKSNLVGPAKFQLRQLIVGELHAAKLKARRIQMGAEDIGDGSKSMAGKDFKEAYAKKVGGGEVQTTRIAVDFFGRPIKAKAVSNPSLLSGKPITLPDSILGRRKEKEDEVQHLQKSAKLKVFYNYHEGYSNAVRKPVKMSSLLL
jgi:chromosome transmission fidelity protein 18